MGVRREKKEGARSIPQPHRTQSAFMKSIITYTWQRAHMHGTKRAHQCLDPTPPHRTSHRTSPPSTNSHARSPGMEQHGSLDGDSRPIYARQASNRYLITCTRLFRSVPGGAVDCRHPHLRIAYREVLPISFNATTFNVWHQPCGTCLPQQSQSDDTRHATLRKRSK